jgi:hypothetical protein
MSKKEEAPRRYVVLSKAWYGKACLKNSTTGNGHIPVAEEVTITIDEGGLSADCGFVWEELQREPAAKFEAFHDSWLALSYVDGLLVAMAELGDKNPSPDDICAMLDRLGFVDATETER